MLESLYIKNYAIIDEIEIQFHPHFNVITGETGAGKSILLGALGLILGERADSKVLYQSKSKCVVEANFKLSDKDLDALRRSDDYDLTSQIVLRREINHSGKSRAFVNDSLVRLGSLKQLADQLVEIHNQFDSLSIVTPDYQMKMIDALANNHDCLIKYGKRFSRFTELSNELRILKREKNKTEADLDYLLYQLKELDSIPLEELDKQALERELRTLTHFEEIQKTLTRITQTISEADPSMEDLLLDLLRDIHHLGTFNSRLAEIGELLNESLEILRESQRSSEQLFDDLNPDPARMLEITELIDQINRLEKKHNVRSIEELIEIKIALEDRTRTNQSYDELITKKSREVNESKKRLGELADQLTKRRKKQFEPISDYLEKMLGNLAMPNSTIQFEHQKTEEFGAGGCDEIILAFSANKGVLPQPVSEIASGGEISRLALAVKSLIAGHIEIGTLIFDEIDTGISGSVAVRVSEILDKLSDRHQIITITHSPQVAARAQKHLFVHKGDRSGQTFTQVRKLSSDERIEEIAKMLSTDPPSEAAIKNASELLAM